jgi:hypothetical protein
VGGFVLGVLTEGMALPVVASLLANMAGDAAIGALSELTTEAVDGQQINGGKVGMAALVNAGFSLAGFGLGRLSKLKGTRNRPFGGLMMEEGGADTSYLQLPPASRYVDRAGPRGGLIQPQPRTLRDLAADAVVDSENAMTQAQQIAPSAIQNELIIQNRLNLLLEDAFYSEEHSQSQLLHAAWKRFYQRNPTTMMRNVFRRAANKVFGHPTSDISYYMSANFGHRYISNMGVIHVETDWAITRDPFLPVFINEDEEEGLQTIASLLGLETESFHEGLLLDTGA